MEPKHPTAPGALSPAGHAALSDAPTPMPELSADTLPRLRVITRALYADAAQRAVDRSGVRVEETNIAGVPCLKLHPAGHARAWPILYCYGGGFVTGSPFEDLIIAAPLCANANAQVILPHYRLAPEHPWPTAVEDGYLVYRAVARDRVALVGESAGGNLALALMARAKAEGLNLPSAVGLLSPWCDLTHAGDSMTANDGRDPTLSLDWVRKAAMFYAGDTAKTNPEISPIFSDLRGLPPTILTTGTRDLLQSQVVRLARLMREAGCTVDLRVWDGLWHVFEFDDRLPEAAQSVSEVAAFLAEWMDGP